MYEIKKINKEMYEKYFEEILELKNYSSRIHFKDENVEEFNRKKLEEVYQYLEREQAILFIALEDKRVVGYIWGYPHKFFQEKRLYVNSLVVNKKYSGKGIGKLLLKTMEKYAREEDYDAMDLNVLPSNEIAFNLYKKFDFEIERYQMRKELKSD